MVLNISVNIIFRMRLLASVKPKTEVTRNTLGSIMDNLHLKQLPDFMNN